MNDIKNDDPLAKAFRLLHALWNYLNRKQKKVSQRQEKTPVMPDKKNKEKTQGVAPQGHLLKNTNKSEKPEKNQHEKKEGNEGINKPAYGIGLLNREKLSKEEASVANALLQKVKKTIARETGKLKKQTSAKRTKPQKIRTTAKVRASELVSFFEDLQKKPRHHMLCFVMYDIQNNKVRKHVADYLEAKGLRRIQLSVFFGEVDRKVYNLLHETLLDIQASYINTDSLMMVPVSEDEIKSMKLIGKEVDFEFAIIRKNTMFF